MPEYDTDDERPPRNAIYEREMAEVVPARFDVEQDDSMNHPQINLVTSDNSGVHRTRIYDMRTREKGGDKVCCRFNYTVESFIEHDVEDFDTLAEAETWLMEVSKQVLEYQQDESTVEQDLNTQVTLHN